MINPQFNAFAHLHIRTSAHFHIFARTMNLTQEQIFSITDKEQFNVAALKVFQHQANVCAVYNEFVKGLNIDPLTIKHVHQIPFLPVEFFKSHKVVSSVEPTEAIFTSSGTTGITTSSHYMTDVSWYVNSFRNAFRLFYGDIENYTILALLPSYLEREGSSLIYMVGDLIARSNNADSGFFL